MPEPAVQKILIVDDEPDVTFLLRTYLENDGFDVDTCSNGGEALDLIGFGNYKLVIMDYFLPLLKGDTVCQSVRSEGRFNDLPIIIMTGFVDKSEEFFKDKGATEVLYKPVRQAELVSRVKHYLAP